MGDKMQAKKGQSMASISPISDGLLQRKCDCGNHSTRGSCGSCAKKSGMLNRSVSPSTTVSDSSPSLIATHGFGKSGGGDLTRVPAYADEKVAKSRQVGGLTVQTRTPERIQAKLKISTPGDVHEQEADRVAEQLMRMPGASGPSRQSNGAGRGSPGNRIATRKAETEKAETDDALVSPKRLDEDDEIKGKLAGPATEIAPGVEQGIRGLSGGQPLPNSERQFFEPRLGHNFADVRIHADTQADSLAQAVHARAFTRGNHVVFASGQYAPGTAHGRSLLAHELTHVVQQGHGAPSEVQRDLATPSPKPEKPKQPDLTAAQISAAIDFNKARYDDRNTREIQDLVGTKPTGTWVEADIKAVALLQEEFGLAKNGQVDEVTFRFLDNEVRLEKLSKTEEKHCLLVLNVTTQAPVVGPVTGGNRSITAKFNMSAQFSNYCGCADYEYRQFIRGHWIRKRGGVDTDLGNTFTTEPAGQLNTTFDEDGNTTTAALNYGHRDQTAEAGNHYIDDADATDQAAGCRYEGEDNPGGPDQVQSGDVFDIDVNFRGEIRRKGTVVATKTWTAIKGLFPVP